ncbi:ankyrin repeat domain-containing protein [Aquibacillus rhizosphaerae]|uniref:Ankyrin repeat domain-containing protein n=1 Tax=Aquibacillus rhizosphaerae TaxID=3051431 RepID=A0ABT7L786_9BACI|nr:ankyrin repeat domain-containing protein [Aquibacillus sp. LR5S19]MDL4841737.1 ankyrin repeat domain-containing protein [Aquibacillus sp. LR5S19]
MNKEYAIRIYELIKNGDIEKAKEIFITNNSLLDFVTPFGTWLHVAARAGELEMIKFLVDSGMDINIIEGVPKSAPIAQAASEGELSIVKYLFDNGAILDVSDPNRNPLFSSIYGGNLDIAKYLVQNGIDITVKYTGDTMKDMDAYAFAVERGQTGIAEYLKQKMDEKK